MMVKKGTIKINYQVEVIYKTFLFLCNHFQQKFSDNVSKITIQYYHSFPQYKIIFTMRLGMRC